MQIICISGEGSSRTQALAEALAHKLGYHCLSRQELVEVAIKEGVQVGKLETAMIKPQIFTERLALEREYYRAFITSFLGNKTRKNGLVYNGRSGHLLFMGIDHALKVRVVEDTTSRMGEAMQQLGVDSKKARRYLKDVENDRNRWARSMYGASLEDSANYDFMLNLGHVSVGNAAAALASMAQLPDFQVTPASKRAIEDLVLAADARVLLARDERTFRANVTVRADRGAVTVTYLPHDAAISEIIPKVLAQLEDVRELSVTMATTNLLWIGEAFEAASETFHQVVEIATKWNAAVELLQYVPQDKGTPSASTVQETASWSQQSDIVQSCAGGIEDEETEVCEHQGFRRTLESLARFGCSGGGRRIAGSTEQIVKAIDRTIPYSLVVVGNMFMAKAHSAQIRMTRQLQGYLSDEIKAPVVNADDLKREYLFGRQDVLNLLGCLGLFVGILFMVFSYQKPILAFLSGVDFKSRIMASATVLISVPAVAYLYGNVARSLMKLIRME